MRATTRLAIASLALPAAQALKITPGSECETKCGNVLGSTSPDEIVCKQTDYDVTDAGEQFKDCVECLSRSVYASDEETDTQWMLYNLRYALSYCLFGTPDHKVQNSQCMTSEGCGHYKKAIVYKNMSSDVAAYDYCNAWPGDATFKVTACQDCLHLQDDHYMANYIIALDAGCSQKPDPGLRIGLDGDIFSDVKVNATETAPAAVVDPSWFDNGPLSLPVKVGIGAAGVAFLLMLMGLCVVWNGRRRRRAFLRKIEKRNSRAGGGWPSSPEQQVQQVSSYFFQKQPPQQRQQHQQHRQMDDTPLSQRPLRGGWNESPMSAHTDEKGFPRYFSPYSSQYNSPVSAQDTPAPQWQNPATMNIGVALGGGDSSSGQRTPPSPETEDASETYEMHHVDGVGGGRTRVEPAYPPQPPTLAHPGYGRSSDSLPRRYALTESDAIRGRAF